MLLSFTLRNYGPYRDEATFHLTAVPTCAEHAYNLQDLASGAQGLRVALVLGANGSGKSQLASAYATFRRIVLESFRASGAHFEADSWCDEGLPTSWHRSFLAAAYRPFAFRKERPDTEFEAVFEGEGAQYQYGFTYNAHDITSEWLYLYRTDTTARRRTTILERSGPDGSAVRLGPSVRRACATYIEDVPHDALVVSFLSMLKLKTDVFGRMASAVASVLSLERMSDVETGRMLADYFGSAYERDQGAGLIDFRPKNFRCV